MKLLIIINFKWLITFPIGIFRVRLFHSFVKSFWLMKVTGYFFSKRLSLILYSWVCSNLFMMIFLHLLLFIYYLKLIKFKLNGKPETQSICMNTHFKTCFNKRATSVKILSQKAALGIAITFKSQIYRRHKYMSWLCHLNKVITPYKIIYRWTLDPFWKYKN